MNTIDGSLNIKGSLSVQGGFFPSAGTITGSHITSDPGSRIPSSKVVHQVPISKQLIGPTTNISAVTEWLYQIDAAGTVDTIDATISGAATGDRAATLDIKKSTGGGAFATILSAPISVTSATAVRTAVSAAISAAALVAGDILQAVVAVTGSSGTQPQGLLVTMHISKDPS